MIRLFLVLTVAIYACETPSPIHKVASQDDMPTRINPEGKKVDIDSVKLNLHFSQLSQYKMRNIGEFFDHRLRFYKVDNPHLNIHTAAVNEVVMYFIDSTLARLRYKINREVGSYLLDSLGMSKFKPLDSLSKDLAVRRKVYDKYSSRLHPELKNYELIWRSETSVKRYRVKTYPDSLTTYYLYDEMPGYKQKIRELETMYNYLEQSAMRSLEP